MRKRLEAMLPKALDKLEEKIEEGDSVALKLLLERTLPTYKQTDKAVKLPELENAPLDQWPNLIMGYLAKGKITPEQGKLFAELHGWVMKGKEMNEFSEFLRRVGEGEPALAVAESLAEAA
jgi:hypothetical protein